MKDYILSHGTDDDLHTYEEMRLISKCHSKAFRYPTIKGWFLERFPEIKQFGVREDAEYQEGDTGDDVANENTITTLPVSA